ncbi:MAG TPA: GNAT family N-acetyltransferase [Steroidobacteraceae bacterium]|nr:GNAT family N-acetyltransferase [Steroidobacteraceae bacterium]
MSSGSAVNWQWCRLGDLSAEQLYAVFAARIAVFVVEQNCPYQELDGLDTDAEHLIAWSGMSVAGYLRVLAPDTRFAEPSIGRIITAKEFRGTGLGRELVARGIERARMRYPGSPLRIGAQLYLEKFYQSFGFRTVSEQYLEDDIPHVEMLLAP